MTVSVVPTDFPTACLIGYTAALAVVFNICCFKIRRNYRHRHNPLTYVTLPQHTLPLSLFCEYNAVSAIADEIWYIVRVETSRYLTKITTPVAKVLAAKHTASLQLLCIVSGNQARLDARTEFKILEPSPKGVEAGRAHHCRLSFLGTKEFRLLRLPPQASPRL